MLLNRATECSIRYLGCLKIEKEMVEGGGREWTVGRKQQVGSESKKYDREANVLKERKEGR